MLDTLIRLFVNIVLFMLRILCYAVSLRFLFGEIIKVTMLDTLSSIYGYMDHSVCFIYDYTEFSVSFLVDPFLLDKKDITT